MDPPPDRLVPEMTDGPRIERDEIGIGLDRGQKFRQDRRASIGDAELTLEVGEVAKMALDRRRPHRLERLAGECRGHPRIAVTVATDPGPVLQERRRLDLLTPDAGDAPTEIPMHAGHGVPDGARQMVHPAPDLIGDVEALRPDLVGRQQQTEQSPGLGRRRLHLRVGAVRGFEHRQQFAEPSLLADDAPTAGLGRMGGQGRLDVEPSEELRDLGRRPSGRRELAARLLDRLGPRRLRTRRKLPSTVDADDVVLLGLVAKMEGDRQMGEVRGDHIKGQIREIRPFPRRGGHSASKFGQRLHGDARFDLGEPGRQPVDVTVQGVGHVSTVPAPRPRERVRRDTIPRLPDTT